MVENSWWKDRSEEKPQANIDPGKGVDLKYTCL